MHPSPAAAVVVTRGGRIVYAGVPPARSRTTAIMRRRWPRFGIQPMGEKAVRGILLTICAAGAAPAFAAAPAEAPAIAITIHPEPANAQGAIPALDLTILAHGIEGAPGTPILELPIEANTVVTSADDITGLTAHDARGAVTLTPTDKAADDANRTRFWHADRAIEGPLTLTYRVTIDAARPFISRPQYELRTGHGSFSGAGNAFLVLPADETARRVTVDWDLSAMAPDASGVSSFGIGDVHSTTPLPPGRIASTYYIAGDAGTYRSDGGGFFAGWTGNPPFSTDALMGWAARLHGFYGEFFGYTPASFGVFTRPNPSNPGSGIGLTDSFAFTYGPESEIGDLRGLLAHEMLHSWVRSLEEPTGESGGLDRSWFGEGLAVHYQRMLPYRAGLVDAEAFLEDLNKTAGRYYTNIKIATPNAEIPAGFWRDTRIRVLPYDRGSLYFAALDAKLREASGGKRSLDDLVRAMLAERRAGRPMDEALWRRLLRAELGQAGIDDFEAMLAGETVLPPSDAFGPCFRRTTRPLRRFDLGFDPESLLVQPRAVRGLKPGSEAAKAGLRNGDVITNTFSQDGLQADQQAFLTLEVARGDENLTIRYRPRGETVEAYQWEKVSSASCNPAS